MLGFALAVGAAAALALILPSQYATQTTLLITPRVAEAIGEGRSPIVRTFSPEIYRNLATARDLLSEIISSLDLRKNPDQEGLELMPVESLRRMMEPKVETGEFPLLTMTVKGSEPQQLRAIATEWAQLFIERNSRLLATATAQSYDFISRMFEETRTSLTESEAERKAYQLHHPLEILEAEIAVLTSRYSSFLTELHNKRLELTAKSAQLQELEAALKDEPQFLELQRSISNDALWNLLGNGISLGALRALPALTVTDQQLNSIYIALRDRLNHTRIAVTSLQSEVDYLERTTAEFRHQLDEKTSRLVEVRLTLAQLDRGIGTLTSTFNMLANRLQEARIAKQEEATSIRIVESAIAPEVPIGPNKIMIVAVAGVLGLFVGVLVAFFKHYMTSGAAKPKEESGPQAESS